MNNILLDDICFKIKRFRERAGYTQQQVSNLLNIERSTYSYYELGKTIPDLKTLIRLSEIFKEPLSSLLSNEEREMSFSDPDNLYYNNRREKQNNKNDVKEITKSEYKNCDFSISTEQTEDVESLEPLYDFSVLSEDEKNIILCFRTLPYDTQEKIRGIITERCITEERLRNKFDFTLKEYLR